MRRTVLLMVSVSVAVLLGSGVALAEISSEQYSGRSFEPEWMDEPMAAQGVQTSLFAGHWTSVTPDEKLYYYNPGKIYPSAVAQGARAWNALDTRFNGRGVRLIRVNSRDKATVRIKRISECANESLLGFSGYREGRPNLLAINTCVVNRYDAKIRNHFLAHELGHHLGSGHQRARFCGKSIMVVSVPCGRERIVLTKPGVRDVRWYKNRWVG